MYFARSYIFQSHHLEPPLKWPFGTWGSKSQTQKTPHFHGFPDGPFAEHQKNTPVNFRERPAGDHFCVAAPTSVALEYCQVDLQKGENGPTKIHWNLRPPARFGQPLSLARNKEAAFIKESWWPWFFFQKVLFFWCFHARLNLGYMSGLSGIKDFGHVEYFNHLSVNQFEP